jgi:hypothetical protein
LTHERGRRGMPTMVGIHDFLLRRAAKSRLPTFVGMTGMAQRPNRSDYHRAGRYPGMRTGIDVIPWMTFE